MNARPSPDEPDASKRYRLASLAKGGAPAKLAGIGLAVLAIAACFAYVAGWLSPDRLTQGRIIHAFEEGSGIHPGFRRNHAKGLCVAGTFESNGAGERLSKALVFRPGSSPVIGRISFAGGQPFVADAPGLVRSMALSFRPAGRGEWRTGMINIPVFPVKDPEAFYQQLVAAQPDPATGKPDPAKMQAFVAGHPETAAALEIIRARTVAPGFASESYNGLNTFLFVDAEGRATPVRWSMMSSQQAASDDPTAAPEDDTNYLFNALIERVESGPLQWHLIVTVGQTGDPTDDATLPWPADRQRLDLGTLTIDGVEAEAPGNCRDLNFDPLVLPDGIEASTDPLLSARSAAYARSFTKREGEPKQPSAVQIPSADKGA